MSSHGCLVGLMTLAGLMVFPSLCAAGSWTLPPGTGQGIARFAFSDASKRLGGAGVAEERGAFLKREWSLFVEAGLLDGLNFVGDFRTLEEVDRPGRGIELRWRRTRGEGGLRLRIADRGRLVLSLEATAGYSRESNRETGVDASGVIGRAGLSLGRSWELFGRPGYSEIHVRRQWNEITTGRNAYHADVAFGWRPVDWLLLTSDVFNRFETGPELGRGRETTMQVGLIYDLSKRLSLEIGGRRTLSGANVELQTTIFSGVWLRY